MGTRKPKKGDLVEVHWIDHAGSDGEVSDADCPVFISVGYWVGYRRRRGRSIIVTSRSRGDSSYASGWDSYTAPSVVHVEVIRPAVKLAPPSR